MNKVFLGIILVVCILGMALVLLNNRLGRKPESRSQPPVAEAPIQRPGQGAEESEAMVRAREIAEAARGISGGESEASPRPPLAAPVVEDVPRTPGLAPLPEPKPDEIQQNTPPQEAPAIEPAPTETATRKPEPKPEPRPEPKPEPKPAAPADASAETAKPAARAAAPGAKSVSRFVVYAREKGATVRIGGDTKMDYSSMNLENPERVVVDLPGQWKFPANPGVPKNDLVSAVRVGQSGDKTRVVIDLKEKPRRILLVPFKNGNGVDVRVDR